MTRKIINQCNHRRQSNCPKRHPANNPLNRVLQGSKLRLVALQHRSNLAGLGVLTNRQHPGPSGPGNNQSRGIYSVALGLANRYRLASKHTLVNLQVAHHHQASIRRHLIASD